MVDLAKGHAAALKKPDEGCGLFVCDLGTGKGYSVLDVLHAYVRACGRALPYGNPDQIPAHSLTAAFFA